MTLENHINALFKLYGKRNAIYLRGDRRILFLHQGLAALGKHIRHGASDRNAGALLLASCFARACAFADSYIELPIVEALSEKYPMHGCGYCQSNPCQCPPKRTSDITLATISPIQMKWSISDWCGHFDTLYGTGNRKLGIAYVFMRLYEEVCEAHEAEFYDAHRQGIAQDEIRRRLSREFADVFAWIFSIANILNIDLETAVDIQYGSGCRSCRRLECECGAFTLRGNHSSSNPSSQVISS